QEPDGIVVIKFKEKISAEACVLKNNGRFFSGRRIEAEIYDGKQKFKKTTSRANETEEEEAARLEKYAKWLEDGGGGEPEVEKPVEKKERIPAASIPKPKGILKKGKSSSTAYDVTPPRGRDHDDA
ncbi:6346_t:CDS:2, partial [Ambispora leptoticha]